MTNVLITHVKEYTGPGTLAVLLREKMHPFCHNLNFEDEAATLAFEEANPGATALRGQIPESLYAELKERQVALDAVVFNDVFPINVLAPNYLYSEAYYPRARFIDDPKGRKEIADIVPMGRLGDPEEAGEVVAFVVSGRSTFMTGQVINFTGGWP